MYDQKKFILKLLLHTNKTFYIFYFSYSFMKVNKKINPSIAFGYITVFLSMERNDKSTIAKRKMIQMQNVKGQNRNDKTIRCLCQRSFCHVNQ